MGPKDNKKSSEEEDSEDNKGLQIMVSLNREVNNMAMIMDMDTITVTDVDIEFLNIFIDTMVTWHSVLI